MELQAETLYRLDERGRMLRQNDPDRGGAPRVFLGRTLHGNVWRLRHDLEPALATELEMILGTEPVTGDLAQPPMTLDRLLVALGAAPSDVSRGPAWWFPRRPEPPSGVVRVTGANRDVLARHFAWLVEELADWSPCAAVLRDGAAVSVCFSSRLSARAAEAGVETAEPYRGRGLAPLVVSAWACLIYESGRLPLYSTSWENAASRAVARKLGISLYGEDISIR